MVLGRYGLLYGGDLSVIAPSRGARLLPRDDRGAVLPLVALWMPVMILFTIFVIDVGNSFVHQRHLQIQADAAAFAGGSQFQKCFGGDTGDSAIFREASTYAGVDGEYLSTLYQPTAGETQQNFQIGGANHGLVHGVYQSPTYIYPVGDPGPAPDDTQTTGPCTSPYMFDVKMTEAGLPLFFRGFVGWTGLTDVNVRAHARVQLLAAATIQPDIPLAPPGTNFSNVVATFTNGSGAELTGCSGSGLVVGTTCTFNLDSTGGCIAVSGLAVSCGSATIPVSTGTTLVRIGAGSTSGSCAGSGSSTLQCYGLEGNGLFAIRGYANSGQVVYSVNPTTLCAANGSTFFSDFDTTTGCSGGVTALIDASQVPPTTSNLSATLSDGSATNTRVPMNRVCTDATNPNCYDAARKAWYWATTVSGFTILPGVGLDTVTIKMGNQTLGAPTAIQQFYGAGVNSGQIKLVQVDASGGSLATSLPTGSQTVTVDVGFGTFEVRTPCSSAGGNSGANYHCPSDPTILLRNQSGGSSSNHFSIDCGPGAQKDQFLNGCTDSYQIHPSPYSCPDGASPPDCAWSQTGCAVGNVDAPMSTRFGDSPNNYPNYSTDPTDPRLVTLIVTDFNAWSQNGTFQVPVIAFAAFYITGWDKATGSQVSTNEPFPDPGSSSGCGDVWGHFVKLVDIDADPSTSPCSPTSPTPCTVSLTK